MLALIHEKVSMQATTKSQVSTSLFVVQVGPSLKVQATNSVSHVCVCVLCVRACVRVCAASPRHIACLPRAHSALCLHIKAARRRGGGASGWRPQNPARRRLLVAHAIVIERVTGGVVTCRDDRHTNPAAAPECLCTASHAQCTDVAERTEIP